MPKYTPAVAKAKAKKLTNDYLAAGLNQAELARRRGVHRASINKSLKKAPVQETMAAILDRVGVTDDFLGKKIKEGLAATKGTKKSKVPDHQNRHKYVSTALEVKKHIKSDEDAKPVTIILKYGHRKEKP